MSRTETIAGLTRRISETLEDAAESLDADNVVALILASSWATGEVTIAGTGSDMQILSDVDTHLITHRSDHAAAQRLTAFFKDRLPEIAFDCHAVTAARLRRLRPTIESASTGTTGRVIVGERAILDRFPSMSLISASEKLRLIMNRTVELLEAVEAEGASDLVRSYTCVKALSDVANIVLPAPLPSYRARRDALDRHTASKPEEAAVIDLVKEALSMKLNESKLSTDFPVMYKNARRALLFAAMHLEAQSVTLPLDSALVGWARVFRNPCTRIARPKASAILKDPRSELYRMFLCVLKAVASVDDLNQPAPRGLGAMFPVRTTSGSADTSILDHLRSMLEFYKAEVRSEHQWQS